MAIILRNIYREYCAIQEIPKCGSAYIAKILHANNIPFLQTNIPDLYNPVCSEWQREVMGMRSSHCIPRSDELYQKTQRENRTCFIRHPFSWLMSWWKFKMEWKDIMPARGWRNTSRFDQLCKSDNFNEFIDNYLEHYPDGLVWHFFKTYLDECATYGRMENLKGELEFFIQRLLHRSLKDIDKANTTEDHGLRYTKEQADEILKREAVIVGIYKSYGQEVPAGYVEGE